MVLSGPHEPVERAGVNRLQAHCRRRSPTRAWMDVNGRFQTCERRVHDSFWQDRSLLLGCERQAVAEAVRVMQSYLAWAMIADREREIERELVRRSISRGLARRATRTPLAIRLRQLFGLEAPMPKRGVQDMEQPLTNGRMN